MSGGKGAAWTVGGPVDAPAAAGLMREIVGLRSAMLQILDLHDEAHLHGDPPDVVCRMRWVALSELHDFPTDTCPWWESSWATPTLAATRRKLAQRQTTE